MFSNFAGWFLNTCSVRTCLSYTHVHWFLNICIFSIFAGLTILWNLVLMVTWVPAWIVLHHKVTTKIIIIIHQIHYEVILSASYHYRRLLSIMCSWGDQHMILSASLKSLSSITDYLFSWDDQQTIYLCKFWYIYVISSQSLLTFWRRERCSIWFRVFNFQCSAVFKRNGR